MYTVPIFLRHPVYIPGMSKMFTVPSFLGHPVYIIYIFNLGPFCLFFDVSEYCTYFIFVSQLFQVCDLLSGLFYTFNK